MEEHPELSSLVDRARSGEQKSLDELARLAEPRLRSYFYRTLLDKESTDDLVQEVLLEMIKSLSKLKKPESFWQWLITISSNKLKNYFRITKRFPERRFSTIEDYLLDDVLNDGSESVDSLLINRELNELIFEMMGQLNVRHRAIVNLRCFESMSFSQISQAVGCSETVARVSFFHAKHKLRRQMIRKGLNKTSLLAALVMFGKLTAPSHAAASTLTVSASAINAGGIGSILSAPLKYRFGKIFTAAAVVSVCSFCAWYFLSGTPERDDVQSVNFTVQGIGPASYSSSSVDADNSDPGYVSKGAYETWLYFPKGPDSPVLRRDQRWMNLDKTDKACCWLQDGKANYYYNSGEEVVYVSNEPLRMLLLPTDDAAFSDFLLSQCSMPAGLDYNRDEKTGLLTGRIDNRIPSVKDYKTTYRYNTSKSSFFDYNWPETVNIVDERDEMHMRGWTWFRVEGLIGDTKVSGRGRIPFVYSTFDEHRPWFELNIGDKVSILERHDGSYVLDHSGQVLGRYPGGSFFAGLAKPWMGMTAYDIVRRDAARKRIEFSSQCSPQHGRVTLYKNRDYVQTTVSCDIDMERGVVDRIELDSFGGSKNMKGFLEFTYLQGDDLDESEFIEPALIECDLPIQEDIGIMWLIELAQGFFDGSSQSPKFAVNEPCLKI